ncbi:MAG: class I tRNA ligase family protein, partial [Myxococcota bacterium]
MPALETATLDYWNGEAVFQRSIDQRSAGEGGENEYVFYDGPPFANGLPHYGHLITSYIKDIIPRYQTLRGRRVERRFGWDCHGLPAELEAEKELGVSGRSQIIEYGIARFNDQCRTSVLRYTDEWQQTIGRAARWVDFENDYKTL